MKQEWIIKLPARKNIPETSIYTEIHTKSGSPESLGQRDVLILMPGGPGNDHTVCDYGGNSFAEELVAYIDIILFDPRGCGRSEPSPIEYCTLEEYINDVEALRAYFKIQPTQGVLFGVSYGAIAALGYAVKYPENFKKLVLVGGAVSGDFIDQARQNLLAIATPAQLAMGEKILSGNFELTPDMVAGYYETMGPLYSSTFQPGLPTPSITYNVELANFGFKKFLRNFNYQPGLSKIKSKTLIIAGDKDWISDQKQALAIHHGIKNSELITYENCGHMIWIDRWGSFLNDIVRFVKN